MSSFFRGVESSSLLDDVAGEGELVTVVVEVVEEVDARFSTHEPPPATPVVATGGLVSGPFSSLSVVDEDFSWLS